MLPKTKGFFMDFKSGWNPYVCWKKMSYHRRPTHLRSISTHLSWFEMYEVYKEPFFSDTLSQTEKIHITCNIHYATWPPKMLFLFVFFFCQSFLLYTNTAFCNKDKIIKIFICTSVIDSLYSRKKKSLPQAGTPSHTKTKVLEPRMQVCIQLA